MKLKRELKDSSFVIGARKTDRVKILHICAALWLRVALLVLLTLCGCRTNPSIGYSYKAAGFAEPPVITIGDNGAVYRVVITNREASTTSNGATLTVQR